MAEGIIDSTGAVGPTAPRAGPPVDGYRQSATFTWPERIPWSELGPEFAKVWGWRDGTFQPEHMEITGQNGSGKTYFLETVLQQRAAARGSQIVMLVTKRADDIFAQLGWPIVDTWKEVKKQRHVIFWAQTDKQGRARKAHLDKVINRELLEPLWQPKANTILACDEIGFVESLSRDTRDTVQMYWREARSLGITMVGMKQRPLGVVRDQHSESKWKVVFPPADRGDMDRFAELLGTRRDWAPVLDTLDQENHEFVIRNSFTRDAFISWVDLDLKPVPAQANQPDRTAREYLFGREKVG